MIPQLYLGAALAAVLSGSIDAVLARTNKPIKHAVRAWARGILGVAYVLALGSTVYGYPRMAICLVGGGAAYVIAFRFWMNSVRSLPPGYVSAGNWYDRQWMHIARRLKLQGFGGEVAYMGESAVALAVAVIYTLL